MSDAKSLANAFDVIVIGSGMGGMTTAAALSRLDHKVLLLEQAHTIGGLTHAFTRDGFTWDVNVPMEYLNRPLALMGNVKLIAVQLEIRFRPEMLPSMVNAEPVAFAQISAVSPYQPL